MMQFQSAIFVGLLGKGTKSISACHLSYITLISQLKGALEVLLGEFG